MIKLKLVMGKEEKLGLNIKSGSKPNSDALFNKGYRRVTHNRCRS